MYLYLDRPIPEIVKDLDISKRPLLHEGVQTIYDLYRERQKKYLDACDIHIINIKDIDTMSKMIIEEIIRYQETIR